MQRHPEGDALAEAEEAYLTARPAADSVSAGEWGLRALLILLVVDIFIVAPIAQGGTSVVQPVVHSIVLGSGIAFDDRGLHELKGVPDPRRLYAVALQ